MWTWLYKMWLDATHSPWFFSRKMTLESELKFCPVRIICWPPRTEQLSMSCFSTMGSSCADRWAAGTQRERRANCYIHSRTHAKCCCSSTNHCVALDPHASKDVLDQPAVEHPPNWFLDKPWLWLLKIVSLASLACNLARFKLLIFYLCCLFKNGPDERYYEINYWNKVASSGHFST